MKKILISVGVLISLTGVVYANGYFQQIFNFNTPNAPVDTILEQEFQLNGIKLLITHGLVDGNGGMKEKEVRVEAVHIVSGASVVTPGFGGIQGDGNFYVQDGDSFFNGRTHNQLREIESHPQMVLGKADYNVVLLPGTIEAISTEGWREGDIVALRFRDPNLVKHLGQADPGFARIKFKDNLSHKMPAYSTLLLGLDKYDNATHQLTWYEL